ncbi:MAG: DUF86 domain-containing protein [Deltaproteobacteria bacterium]|nr:DUF86 domain-containing protein [Deltaproteobacteria bacterium]
MDSDVIYSKIDSLHRCIARIESKVPGSVAELASDIDRQDIIVLNLERSVQQSVDIAMHLVSQLSDAPTVTSMGDAFSALHATGILSSETADHMRKAVGFRNTAVHAYQQMDMNIIYAIITKHLNDFRSFAKEICQAVER